MEIVIGEGVQLKYEFDRSRHENKTHRQHVSYTCTVDQNVSFTPSTLIVFLVSSNGFIEIA